jgi:recombination protein RecT
MTKQKEPGIEYPEGFDTPAEQQQPPPAQPPVAEQTQTQVPAVQPQPQPPAQLPAEKTVTDRNAIRSISDALKSLPAQLEKLQLSGKRIQTELGFATIAIRKNDYLKKSDPKSIFDAVLFAARIGLTLNPALGFAYLVPRSNKCSLDIGYKGWSAILRTSGAVSDINAFVVYDDEDFDWQPAINKLLHRPKFAKSEAEHDARKVYCAYTVAILPDGKIVHEVIPAWELEKIENTSPASKGYTPYKTWKDEMMRKAPIKRHAKKLLKLQDNEAIAEMFENENGDGDQSQNTNIKGRWQDVPEAELID